MQSALPSCRFQTNIHGLTCEAHLSSPSKLTAVCHQRHRCFPAHPSVFKQQLEPPPINMELTHMGGLIGLAATYVFLRALLSFSQLANEPPTVETSIPFLGPVLAMAKYKVRFYAHLRDKLGLPIYTLRLPGIRMYIINSPKLIPAVQKLWRAISFAAVEAHTTATILLCSKAGNDEIGSGLMNDDSYIGQFMSAVHPATKPGEQLDDMTRTAIRTVATWLDKYQAVGSNEADLFEWVRDPITLATSDAVYGPHNPLRDPEVRKAWE